MGNDMEVDRADPTAFIRKTRSEAPDSLKQLFTRFEELYDRKLWHQLTVALEKFVDIPEAAPYLIPVYENFISDFEKKMNQLSLVQYMVKASREFSDPAESLAFLSTKAEKLKDSADDLPAHILATMEAAHWQLITGDAEKCKESIDKCEKLQEQLPGVEPVINASFYRVSADYYKAKAQFLQFYHSSLLYLSSVPDMSALPKAEIFERAHDLALSALLAEGLYNFGELLMHPILDTLTGTDKDWLRRLLFCFNSGDMDAFDAIAASPEFNAEVGQSCAHSRLLLTTVRQEILPASVPFLRQKLHLMTLIETMFKRTKEQRGHVPFEDVARETRVAMDEVEHLIMRALSLGLIRGKLDELEKVVNITWVQPRTLDRNQIATMTKALDEWSGRVKELLVELEKQEAGAELLVQ
ncbi:hypothetical protein DFJ74DRAFT_644064 [Hyaloraphidium curvatum]|nr:hypothetical protein DFJ74DRAFT_644064 [Hyaloraphidium curvatum]